MTRAAVLSAAFLLLLSWDGFAQPQSGCDATGSNCIAVSPNVNVLRTAGSQYRGDIFLQRQNEPAIAVSTRNPNHIMIAANDYRTVDFANDSGLGDTLTRVARSIRAGVGEIFAKLTGREPFFENKRDEAIERLDASAPAEAWIGLYLSNDGGKSYASYLMPGYPEDTTTSGMSTPAFGKAAGSDPVLASGPAGRIFLGAMVYDRDPVTLEPIASKIVVSRFTDTNNSESGQNFLFDGMTLVEDSGKTKGRKFLDKPAIAVDVNRKSSDPNACGPVYIAYTIFDTQETDSMQRSKIMIARSRDCGAHFGPPRQLSHRSLLNQGVSLAIRPSDGAVFAVYRSFSENKIYLAYKSRDDDDDKDDHNFNAAQIISGPGAILNFDQPTLTAPDYAFRTNGFPTIAIDAQNRAYVAWQERRADDPTGKPAIMIVSSSDGGRIWTSKIAVESVRSVLDAGGNPTPPSAAYVGPQIMPSLSFSRGKLMLVFYEAKPTDFHAVASQQNAYFITGKDAELNVRVAQLDVTGHVLGSSVFVNHYETDKDGNIIPIVSTESDGQVYRGTNRPNLPMYASGTSPFMGDYIALVPTAPFVPVTQPSTAAAANGSQKKSTGPAWRFATEPTDAPVAAFLTAWDDNRDVVFPLASRPDGSLYGTPTINGDWTKYAPPNTGFASCINPGSRNSNVYASMLSPRLFAGSPSAFKQLGIQRAFVMYVENQTTVQKYYRLTIVDAPPAVTGSFNQFGDPQKVLDVTVYANSSVTQNVFAVGQNQTVATQPFAVTVQEILPPLGAVPPNVPANPDAATVVFNTDSGNPPVADSSNEIHKPAIVNPDPSHQTPGDPQVSNPQVSNPQVSNPQVSNPQVSNPQVSNPQVSNPQVSNPQVSNPQVSNVPLSDGQDTNVYTNVTNYTWEVKNVGNTLSAFAPVINIARDAELANKKVTLTIYKTYNLPGIVLRNGQCELVDVPKDIVISTVENPQVSNPQVSNPQVSNPQVSNPQVSNPQVSNPQVSNPQVSNATFFVAPLADASSGSDSTLSVDDAKTYLTLTVQDANPDGTAAPLVPAAPPGGIDPTTGQPLPPPNPPISAESFSSGGSAVAIVPPANDVVNGVVQSLPDAATTGSNLIISSGPSITGLAGNLSDGATITFGATSVQNNGSTPTPATGFKYGFFLSPTPQIDLTTAIALTPTATGNLTYAASIPTCASSPTSCTVTLPGGSFTVPPNAPAGNYYVGVRVNSGDPSLGEPHIFEPEDDDSFTASVLIVTDLGIAQGSVSPTAAYRGQSVTATVTVANFSATTPAPASVTTFTLTNAGGTVLAGPIQVPTGAIAAGATAVVSAALAVPTGSAPGTYTVTVRVDALGNVVESNENNNTFTTTFSVINSTSTLTFQQGPPASIREAKVFPATVAVKVVDRTNAVIPGVTVQLALASVVGSATLSGATTATTNALGVATFAGLAVVRNAATPTVTAAGTYLLSATVANVGAVSSARFVVTANGIPTANNDPTGANAAAYTTSHVVPLAVAASVGLLANDTDPDADPLTAVVLSQPAHGVATVNANGSFVYTPTGVFAGVDTFTYRAFDGLDYSLPATVFLTITDVAPTGGPSAYSIGHGVALNIPAPGPLANAVDPDGDPLTASLASGVSHGTLTLNANGSFTYTSANNFEGIDGFTFFASDGIDNSTPIGVTLHVTDNPPIARSDSYTVTANTTLQVPAPGVLANDSDPDPGDTLTASLNIGPAHGSVTFNADGSFTYQPAQGYTGPDTFTYRDSDGMELSGTATVSLSVVGSTADVSVTQTHMPTNGIVGQLLTYALTVSNAGPGTANGVVVTDVLPAGLTLGEITPLAGSCTSATDSISTITCNVGSMTSGSSTTIMVTATPTVAQPVTTVASVSSTSTDPNTANNTASDTVMVLAYGPCSTPTFSGPHPIALGSPGTPSTGIVATGDFNGDGFADVAVTESNANSIAVLFGDGHGGFSTPAHIPISGSPTFVASGDFNKDGALDLAVATPTGVVLLVGDGEGGFTIGTTVPLSTAPFTIAVADLDADGNLDIVIGSATSTTTTVAVLYGDGLGAFATPVSFPSGPGPLNVLVADFDGDGVLDIAVPNTGTKNVAILRGTGGRSFAAPATIALPNTVARLRLLGDINGDGLPDLAVTTGPSGLQDLVLLLNQGGGAFAAPVEILPAIDYVGFATAADVNGDGKPDLVAISFANDSLLVALGDGRGSFAAPIPYYTGTIENYFAFVDLTGDGKLDIVGTSPGAIYALVNNCGSTDSSNLSVTTTGPTSVIDGTSLSYTLTVSNQGPAFAGGVIVTDVLPSGATFSDASGDGFCTELNGTVSCAVEGLSVGGIASFTVDAQATTVGAQTNRVTATSANADPDTTDNSASFTTSVGINTAPSFSEGPNIAVSANSGAQTFPNWATNLSAGGPGEANQLLDFQVTTDNAGLFAIAPAIDPTGTLTFSPAVNASGVANVTVRLHDNGGTAGGGVDTSAPQTFTIAITPVDQPPIAGSYSTTTTTGSAVTFDPAARDRDPDDPLFSAPQVPAFVPSFAGPAPNLFLPNEIAVVNSTQLAYFSAGADTDSNLLRFGVLDTTTNQVTGVITAVGRSVSVQSLVNETTNIVYFRGSSDLLAIDGRPGSPTFNQAILTLALGAPIQSMAIDELHGRMYVTTSTTGSGTLPQARLLVIDVDPTSATFHQILQTLQAPSGSTAFGVGVQASTNTVWVAVNGGASSGVYALDGTTFAATPVANTSNPVTILVDDARHLVYAGSGNSVYAINAATKQLLTTIALPGPAIVGTGAVIDSRMAIHQGTGHVYVRLAQFGSGGGASALAVIDGNPGPTFLTLLTTIALGREATSSRLVVDEAANRLLATSPIDYQISVIDTVANAVIANIATAQSVLQLALSPQSHTVYGSSAAGFIEAVNTVAATGTPIPVGGEVTFVSVDPATGGVWAPYTSGSADGVLRIDEAGVIGSATGLPHTNGRLSGSVWNPNTQQLFVLNQTATVAGTGEALPGFVAILDASGNHVANVPAGNEPTFSLALNTQTNRAYVGDTGIGPQATFPGGLTVVDGNTFASTPADLSQIPLNAGVSTAQLQVQRYVAVNEATNKVYFAILGSSAVASVGAGVLNGTTNVAAPLAVPTNSVNIIRVNPTLNRVYIGDGSGPQNRIHVFNGATDTEITSVVAGSPTTFIGTQSYVAVDLGTGRVFVSDFLQNVLTVIDGTTNSIIANIPIGRGPSTVAVNQSTHRVYVGNGIDKTLAIVDGASLRVVDTIALPNTPVHLDVSEALSDVVVLGSTFDGGLAVVKDAGRTAPRITSVTQGAHGTVTLNADGSVTYTANANFSGVDSYSYTETDAEGLTSVGTVTVTVQSPLTITTASLLNGLAGQAYSQTLTATGSSAQSAPFFYWSVTSGSLPGGLTLDGSGNIRGTLQQQGTFTFTVTARDTGSTALASATYTIIVGPPVVTTTSLPTATVNQPYSLQLAAGGTTGAVTWSLNTNGDPSLTWLSITPGGLLTGTPPSYPAGSPFTVTVTDSLNQTASRTLTINVSGPLDLQSLTIREGVVMEAPPALPIIGGSGTRTVALTGGQLPPGVTLTASGSFTGVPTRHGTYLFNVHITDSSAPAGIDRAVTWRVSARDQIVGSGGQPTLTFGGSSGVRLAQTFTVGAAGQLTAYGFNSSTSCTNGPGPVTVVIQHLTQAGTPDGVTIASGSNANLTVVPGNLAAIALSPTIDVTVGTKLAAVVSAAVSCTMVQNPPNVDSYQAGDGYIDTGGGWAPLPAASGYDIPFRTLIQPAMDVAYLNRSRGSYAAALLASGKVLLTGNDNSAELYDPSTNTAALTGNMSSARTNHTATVLSDGTVLLVGGRDPTTSNGTRLATAETYDPGTGVFTLTSPMPSARENHRATLLTTGQVLITGGIDGSGNTLASALLYDPGTRSFTSIGSMTTGRQQHTSTLLMSGKVLIAGGYTSGSNQKSAEIYDPAAGQTGTFTATSGNMIAFRGIASATLLNDGTVLIAGGQAGDIRADAEIYQPSTDSFAATIGSMSDKRYIHTATLLSDGSVLIAGGYDEQSVGSYTLPLATLERYLPGSQTFQPAGSMEARRAWQTATHLSNDTVFLAGGFSQSWMTGNTGELYNRSTVPALQTTLLANGQIGQPYLATLAATGGSGGPYQIAVVVSTLPPGLSFDTGSFNISGTPTTAGAFNADVQVTDGGGHTNVQSVTIVIGTINTITSPYRLTDAALNQPYSLQLTASGTSPITWTLLPGNNPANNPLPPGLTLNSTTGVISGTPTTQAYYNFEVRAVDGTGQIAQKALSINVVTPLVITTTSLSPSVLFEGYSGGCLNTNAGVGNRTWSIVAGSLPPGMTLQTNGCFNGAANALGTYTFTAQVTDSASPPEVLTQALSLSIPYGVDQSAGADINQPAYTFGGGSNVQIAQHVTTGVTGNVSAVRLTLNNCPIGLTVTAQIQGVTAAGGPDGNTVASGSAQTTGSFPFYTLLIPISPALAMGADQPFTVVYSADQACAVRPQLGDSNGGGDAYVSTAGGAWQSLHSTPDGRYDVPFQTLVTPASGFAFMSAYRGGHTATVLNDGRVLIAGGHNVQSADIYDPSTGAVTRTGDMHFPRRDHRATLLDDGTVLITGGWNEPTNVPNYLGSAELYHPDTGMFELLPTTMSSSRYYHSATKLADGRVLIAGGESGDCCNTDLPTAEIYTPASRTFTPIAPMPMARREHTATVIPDGRVVLAGGWGTNNAPSTVLLFDPQTQSFTQSAQTMPTRSEHVAALLPDGRVLLAGGATDNGSATATSIIYDPIADTFADGGSMSVPRWYPAAAALADGSVLVTGGQSNNDCCALHSPQASMDRYVPGTGWTNAGSMLAQRVSHQATVLQTGNVLLSGTFGWSTMGSHSVELYEPATAVSLVSTAAPGGSNGVPYAGFTLAGQGGGGGPYTIQLARGGLPPGLTYDSSTHTISGTPTASGPFVPAFTVSSGLSTNTQAVPIGIDALTITSPLQLAPAFQGIPYTATLAATGVGAVTWTIVAQSLPAGLTLTGNTISGIPTNSCCYTSFTVQAVDSIGQTATKAIAINVEPALTISTTSMPDGFVAQGYYNCIPTFGGPGGPSFQLVSGAPPPGLTLQSNGCFMGTERGTGSFQFTVRATDPSPLQADTKTLTINVSLADDQGSAWDPSQPGVSFGSNGVKVGERVVTAVSGPLRGVRLYSTSSMCPVGTHITVSVQGVAANGGPDGITVASGTASYPFDYVAIPGGPSFAADHQFTIVADADQLCTIQPAAYDSNGGEGYVFNGSSWQHLHDVDGQYDIPFQTIVSPPADLGYLVNFRGAAAAAALVNAAASTGKVLIAGGGDETAEVYDPSSNTTSAVASMSTQRQRHTATALNDGTVLVTGGYTVGGPNGTTTFLATAELYHPDTDSWELLSSQMSAARASHSATLLANGDVLIAGGYNSAATLSSADVYHVSSKTFTPVGAMNGARYMHTATLLLSSGRVLVAGGFGPYDYTTQSAELYDPSTSAFTAVSHPMVVGYRGRDTATLLPNGLVLLAGGSGPAAGPTSELYDPASDTFTAGPNLTTPRVDHTATLLPDGHVVLAGGLDDTSWAGLNIPPVASTEVYANGAFVGSGSMLASRYVHTATLLLNGQVLFAGTYGWSSTGSRSFELFDESTVVGLANPVPPAGHSGSSYDPPAGYLLTGTGGNGGPYQIEQTSGSLAGLSYDANTLTIAGTPSQSGTLFVSVAVSDANGAHSRLQAIAIRIDPVAIDTTFLPSAANGAPYNASLTGTGYGVLSWSVFSGSLPPGMSISGAAIVGTPTGSGTYAFVLRAIDSAGQVAYRSLSIVVTGGSGQPNVDPATASTLAGASTPVALIGTDPQNSSLVFFIVQAPAHGTATVSGNTAIYTPAVGYVGQDVFTYAAANGQANSLPAAVTVNVLSGGSGHGWGWNAPGSIDTGLLGSGDLTTTDTPWPVTVSNLYALRDVAGGENFTVGRTADGSVYVWGYLGNFLSGDGFQTEGIPAPYHVNSLSGVTAIGVGNQHVIAVSGGQAYTWGDNSANQLGRVTQSAPDNAQATVVAGISGAYAAAAGDLHSLVAVDDNGQHTVRAWGLDGSGQLGNGSVGDSIQTPQTVLAGPSTPLTNVKALAAGRAHSVALLADGTVWTWGDNSNGQLGNAGSEGNFAAPVTSLPPGIVAIAANANYTLAMTGDGRVYQWGDVYSTLVNAPTPALLTGLPPVASIAAGRFQVIARDAAGLVWTWGENAHNELGSPALPTDQTQMLPRQNDSVARAIGVGAGWGTSFAIVEGPDIGDDIAFSPNDLYFGFDDSGSPTIYHWNQTVTIKNIGTETLNTVAVALGGTNPNEFTMLDGCSGQVLSPGATCQLAFVYSPATPDGATATATVISNAMVPDQFWPIVLHGSTDGTLNHAPVATSQNVETPLNTPVQLTLDGTDADGDALIPTIATQPQHGTLSGDARNPLYRPNTDFIGTDTFSFWVSDPYVRSVAAATVTIHVDSNSYAPAMGDARINHTATLLEDGRVLVAGGSDGTTNLTSAVIYDPSSNMWTFAAPMNVARSSHVAALLPTGQVLVAGGSTNGTGDAAYTDTAEVYDPAYDRWTLVQNTMANERTGAIAVALQDGRVLVAGGADASNINLTADLFDPSQGVFTPTGSMQQARVAHASALLSDGTVLVAGGLFSGFGLTSAETYSPVSGLWTTVGAMSTARAFHTLTMLPGGSTLAVGGESTTEGTATSSAEVFDVGSWTPISPMSLSRLQHTATLLADGRVLVAGGQTDGYAPTVTEIYNPSTGVWEVGPSLSLGRYGAAAVRLRNGAVMFTGGAIGGGDVTNAVDFLSTGYVTTLAAVGGGGGSPFGEILCPSGTVGTQLAGRAGDDVDALELWCGAPASLAGTVPTTSTGGNPYTLSCPADFVLTGIYGTAGEVNFGATLVDTLGATCTNPSTSDTFQTGTVGNISVFNPPPFASNCPAGTAVVGLYGRSGFLVDQLGVICK